MMPSNDYEKAQKLISKGKYDDARKILQPYAFTSPQAAEMLQRLNTIAPPTASGGGSGRKIFGLGIFTCLGCIGVPFVLVCGVIILFLIGANQQQKEAEEANSGKGSKTNPIAANTEVKFENFDIKVTEIKFPATREVLATNMFNDDPAEGTDYALIRVEMTCKKKGAEQCLGSELNIQLIDNEGVAWKGPILLVIEQSLDAQSAISGNTLSGWTVVEFPNDERTISLIQASTLIGPNLYIEPPELN